MGHTFTTVRVHVVFSTYGRRPLLLPEVQPRAWDYIGGIGKNHGIPIHEVGGVEKHVHILLSIPPTVTISKVVQTLKVFSSKWLNETGAMNNGRFAWQEGLVVLAARCWSPRQSGHDRHSFDHSTD